MVLWFIANQFFQDTFWGIVVLDKFGEYFLFASIPVFIVALLSMKKVAIFSATPPLMVCGYFFLPFFLQFQTPQAQSADVYLRVATYNIWNHNDDLDAVVKLINSSGPDVIAIQEITEAQRAKFVDLLSVAYPYYHVSKPVYGGTTALFSRIELQNLIELDSGIDRPAIVADFEWQGKLISIVSAHLNPSFWAYYQKPWLEIPGNYLQYIKDQNTQAQMIIDALKTRTDSIAHFLSCDCNSQETASTNRLLNSLFKETFRSLGWQLGDPIESNLRYERDLSHIDYIWYTGDVEPIAIYRSRGSAGSDHEPLFADFAF